MHFMQLRHFVRPSQGISGQTFIKSILQCRTFNIFVILPFEVPIYFQTLTTFCVNSCSDRMSFMCSSNCLAVLSVLYLPHTFSIHLIINSHMVICNTLVTF